jgi:hypothetical protein
MELGSLVPSRQIMGSMPPRSARGLACPQQIAMLDTETGEEAERRLDHESGEAKRFYEGLQEPALVNILFPADVMTKRESWGVMKRNWREVRWRL